MNKAQKEVIKAERTQELEDIKTLLKTDAGFRFFKRFFEYTSVFSTTFKHNPEFTAFCEGQRNIGLTFFNDICEAAPEKIPGLLIRKEIKNNVDNND